MDQPGMAHQASPCTTQFTPPRFPAPTEYLLSFLSHLRYHGHPQLWHRHSPFVLETSGSIYGVRLGTCGLLPGPTPESAHYSHNLDAYRDTRSLSMISGLRLPYTPSLLELFQRCSSPRLQPVLFHALAEPTLLQQYRLHRVHTGTFCG